MISEEIKLEQYKQAWNQRRQHVVLYWKIPVVSLGLIALIAQLPYFRGIKDFRREIVYFVLLIGYGLSILFLFLRHNFFAEVYIFLTDDMQEELIKEGSEKGADF